MKRKFIYIPLIVSAALSPVVAQAHFLTMFPEQQVIDKGDSKNLHFPVYFTHPMSMGPTMDIVRPTVGVVMNDKQTDLTDSLIAKPYGTAAGWALNYPLRRPGTYTFFANQQPYIDETENVAISQSAKVIVDAFAAGGDWQVQLNTPVEIMPLTRPYALWTNSVFTGKVLVNGQSLAGVDIEVEYYNKQGIPVPSDAYLTQQAVTNAAGEFTVSLPKEGWWGIAALVEDEQPISVDGKTYPHERAGVMWLQVQDID